MRFSELVRLLEQNDFGIIKEKAQYGIMENRVGTIWSVSIYHGSKEVPIGICQAILKNAGIKK
jgi:predicted RNA binding protein YcfA (HicA-like mRNA interferase family)